MFTLELKLVFYWIFRMIRSFYQTQPKELKHYWLIKMDNIEEVTLHMNMTESTLF